MSNKFDDGSQAWFDAQLRMRAQQRHNNKSHNPLDRRVNVSHDPVAKQAEIQDPYIRELVAKRAQQPHYGPIPLEKEVKTNGKGVGPEIREPLTRVYRREALTKGMIVCRGLWLKENITNTATHYYTYASILYFQFIW